MKISRIEHLGIAVKSIEEALPYYEQVLGFECYNIETVDLGVPVLSMHAPFELVSKIDVYTTYKAFVAFLNR